MNPPDGPELARLRAAIEESEARHRALAEERRRDESALGASAERLQLALDAAGMGSFVWYPEEDRTRADERLLGLFGIRRDVRGAVPGEVDVGQASARQRRHAVVGLLERSAKEEPDQSGPLPHGPVIANVIPGVWTLTNSHLSERPAPSLRLRDSRATACPHRSELRRARPDAAASAGFTGSIVDRAVIL